MNKIHFIFFTNEEVLTEILGYNHKELWTEGLNLDDWDYGLITPGVMITKIKNSPYFSNMLNGVCSNEWYEIKSKKGKWYTIGMAYHA